MNLRRLNLLLFLAGLALAVTLVLLNGRGTGGVPAVTESERQAQQQLDVTRAATAQVQAFLSVDDDSFDRQAQVVLDGATGTFKQQYVNELPSLKRSAHQQRTSAEATVLEVGIGDIDPRAATVFVAADTDVTSQATQGRSRTVPWRIQLDMVKEGDRWLTSGLQFVG